MARSPRSEYITPADRAIVLAICRKARTPLAPTPDSSDPDFIAHRVHFIEQLIRWFAQFFCVSVHAHAVLPRELRLVLAAHPELVQHLDDTDVARRWLSLCPTLRAPALRSCELTDSEIRTLSEDLPRIAQIRSRLSDISWFLRLLQQRITSFCNREDNATGRFWGDRYRSVLLLDNVFHSLGMANVDISAALLDTDQPFCISKFTSAILRLRDLADTQQRVSQSSDAVDLTAPTSDHSQQGLHSRHLAPLQQESDHIESGPVVPAVPFRCSDAPAISLHPAKYIELLECILLVSRGESSFAVPDWITMLIQDIQLTTDVMTAFVCHFDQLFSQVAGSPARMAAFVTKSGTRRAWVRPAARELFRRCAERRTCGIARARSSAT
ncbi:MAG: hypothetical protein ACKO2P_10135 [Planctomycetota bacterium]